MRRFVFRTVLSILTFIVMISASKHFYGNDDVPEGDMSGPSLISAEDVQIEGAQIMTQSFMDVSLDIIQEKYIGTEFTNQEIYQYHVYLSHVNEKEELSVQQEIIQYASQQNQEYIPDDYHFSLTMKIFESEEAAKEAFIREIWHCGIFEKYGQINKKCGHYCYDISRVEIEDEEELYRYLNFGDAELWDCDEVILFGSQIYLKKGNRIMDAYSNLTELTEHPSEQTVDAIKRVFDYDFSDDIALIKNQKH